MAESRDIGAYQEGSGLDVGAYEAPEPAAGEVRAKVSENLAAGSSKLKGLA